MRFHHACLFHVLVSQLHYFFCLLQGFPSQQRLSFQIFIIKVHVDLSFDICSLSLSLTVAWACFRQIMVENWKLSPLTTINPFSSRLIYLKVMVHNYWMVANKKQFRNSPKWALIRSSPTNPAFFGQAKNKGNLFHQA